MPASVQWVNEPEWRAAIVAHLKDWEEGLKENLGDLMKLAEDEAYRRCPVRTGKLRAGIQSEVDGDEGRLWDDVEYAPHVEFGTRHMNARPFLRPGMAAAQNQYERKMVEGLE